MKRHRLARIPPSGPHTLGKRLSLCGSHLWPENLTTDPDKVTCQVCIRATTSKRTIESGRAARDTR